MLISSGKQHKKTLTWLSPIVTGHGTYTGIDGDFYRGSWHKDQYHGRGVYVWPDGHMFIGDYFVGSRQGPGYVLLFLKSFLSVSTDDN